MWQIHFTAKEKETNRLLEGDSTKCDYEPTPEQAIQECKDIVAYFNKTLRPYEKPREFVRVERVTPISDPAEDQDDDEDDNY